MVQETETNKKARRAYLPATGLHLFLPLYDPLVTLLGGDPTRKTLINQAALEAGQRVLDIASQSWGLTPLSRSATGSSENILWRLATTKRSLNPPLPRLVAETAGTKTLKFTWRLDESQPL